MAERKSAVKEPVKAARTKKIAAADALSAEEKAAMRETIRERRRAAAGADGLADLLSKIAEMPQPDRSLAERVHAVVMGAVPSLEPRTWYGMPAYAKNGNVICYFQNAGKFKARYGKFGFSDKALLDDGKMWPVEFALLDLTKADEKRLAALVVQAVG